MRSLEGSDAEQRSTNSLFAMAPGSRWGDSQQSGILAHRIQERTVDSVSFTVATLLTRDLPAAPIPSLVIHLMAAVAAAVPAALFATPTAFRRLDVARLVPTQPVMWAGTAHSWNGR